MTNDMNTLAALRNAKAQKSTINLLKRLIKNYVAPHKSPLILAIAAMLIAALMTAAIAQMIQPILDQVLNGKTQSMIIPVAAAFLITFTLRGAASYASIILMNKVSQHVIGDIQKDMFQHLLKLDLSYFHANPSGQLMSTIVNDANILRSTVSDTFMGAGKSFFTLIFLILVMFYQDVVLAFAATVIFPFAAIFVAYLGKRIRKISRGLQQDVASLSNHLAKIFQGIRVVKAYGMEDDEIQRANTAITKVRKMNIKAVSVGALSTPVNEVLVGIILFGIIIYGGFQAANGEMTPGQLGAFLTAFIMAYEPMKKLAQLNNSIQTGLGAAERIFSIIDKTPDIKESPTAKPLSSQKPQIEFKDVEFQYGGTEIKALNKISFKAQNGKVTALVGASGSGKTTIINLIPRFYDVIGGTITIDQTDIRELTFQSLRNHMALVSQDITIFDNSIEANIGYGKAGASLKEIEEAAKAAAAHDFIMSMPEGYNTQVGEDGVKLSGGQRQRIAIARAILRNAPILLLDEATSALDNESEKAVQDALGALQKGRTTIVIAHRLSTVQDADQILVLENGRIIERGTHNELIEQSQAYAKMYNAGFEE